MRTVLNINHKWAFTKLAKSLPDSVPSDWDFVNLPHTWNGIDGQDGAGDYYRGTCYYAKSIEKADLPTADRYYIELLGANASATVYVNGKEITHHDGGYSTFRADITDALEADNLIVIEVDNSVNEEIYPQMADFTFYGGLYRNVNLICVSDSHFDLDYFGGSGVKITPEISGDDAKVEIECYLTNLKAGQSIRYTVLDKNNNFIYECETEETKVNFDINCVHLWNGRKDPYLYTAKLELIEDGKCIDNISSKFGCRSFEIDPERGFILNGEEYPLRGVSRHQDRPNIGNALLPEHHEEDIDLICELGATTIRLAHYQHDQYFYDLCDEKGLVVWAEIPYISKHMKDGRKNTVQQMTELIIQNYNHPSIVVWGISNEITMQSEDDEDLLENHHILNDLIHSMDKTRLSTMACVSMCNIDSDIVKIPDVVSYNHYFGWYGGNTDMNGPWFDNFHKKHPDIPIGCSEYGCEALDWHTSEPTQGDYTEEYQAHYHEELIKQLFTRKYLWATHVWNMFDFAADARAEGGENGMNHKGLVTFDRKYKKDSFYAYKAWLSDEKFVHICSKRYVDRVEDVTKVTVYSNMPEVELFANGKSIGKKEAPDHFFYFDVPNVGETTITAVAGSFKDESHIRKVEEFNEKYLLKEKGAILNWFDITSPEGYLSLKSSLNEILSTVKGKLIILGMAAKMKKNMSGGEKAGGFEINKDFMKLLGGFTLLRLTSLVGTVGVKFTKEELLELNRKLNNIKFSK